MNPTSNERTNSSYPRPETTPGSPETAAEYIVRTFSEALARDTTRLLRAESFARACRSCAEIHCATSDRRDYHADPNYCKHCDDEALLAIDTSRLPEEAVCSNSSGGGQSSHPDAGPARAD